HGADIDPLCIGHFGSLPGPRGPLEPLRLRQFGRPCDSPNGPLIRPGYQNAGIIAGGAEMAGQEAAAAERLRVYLRELKPGARALLIAELERGLIAGNAPAGAEMVLSELRRSLRASQTKSARFDDPARLFFKPVEPFLVDDGPDHKHRGRIARP